MTHDELLAKIDAPNGEFDAGDPTRHHLLLTQNKALRAIVELHKPYSDEGTLMCSYCDWNSYPCGTIEAIEKELK